MNELTNKIIELWNISRTALATQSASRYDRMIYVKNALQEHYPELISRLTPKYLWFAIEDAIS